MHPLGRLALTFLVTVAGTVMLPGAAIAHAVLVESDPADGATVSVPLVEVAATFSEPMDPERSRMQLRDPSGATIAEGGVPPDDETQSTMRIEVPPLAPGTYQVRWTTFTPEDAGVERGTFSFTIAAPEPSATPAEPTGSPTGPSATPSIEPLPSPTSASTGTVPPSATPSATAAPSGTPSNGGGADSTLIPLLALSALAAAAVIFLLRRPRRPIPGP